jgi:hypothetical protein
VSAISHFSRLKTKIKDRDMLIQCLKEMGSVVREGGKISGYLDSMHNVDLAVTMSSGYDIGFVRDTDGAYNIVADWWGVEGADERSFSTQLKDQFKKLEQKIRQSYALNKTLAQLKNQGFNVVKQEQAEDGTIRLLARRWS